MKGKNMTKTNTMPAALGAASQHLGSVDWVGDPSNAEQFAFLESFPRRALMASRMPEARSHGTDVAGDHAAWLAAEGWEAQTTHGSVQDLFLAATLNVVAKWLSPGRAYRTIDGVHRVLLKEGAFTSGDGANQIVKVLTQNPAYSF